MIMPFVKEAGDSGANKEMKGEGNERVDLEESNNKGRCCCSPYYVGGKE